jgi:hypothetical protein
MSNCEPNIVLESFQKPVNMSSRQPPAGRLLLCLTTALVPQETETVFASVAVDVPVSTFGRRLPDRLQSSVHEQGLTSSLRFLFMRVKGALTPFWLLIVQENPDLWKWLTEQADAPADMKANPVSPD